MSFGLSWRCPECNHGMMSLFKGKLKRELQEELESGVESKCTYCEKELELNTSNSVIIKETSFGL